MVAMLWGGIVFERRSNRTYLLVGLICLKLNTSEVYYIDIDEKAHPMPHVQQLQSMHHVILVFFHPLVPVFGV